MRGLRDRARIRVAGLRRGETEAVRSRCGSCSGIARRLGRRRVPKNRNFEIIRVIHAGNVRLRVKQPKNLIARIVVIRDQAFCGRRKIHGNGAAERSGLRSPRGNIMPRLPENNLIGAAVVTRSGNELAHTGETQFDAMLRGCIEFQVNPSTHTFAGRKGQRLELEVRVAEAPMANCGAQGLYYQNHAKQVEAEEQKHTWVAIAREIRNHAEEKRERNQIAENGEHPGGDFALLVLTFRAARRPIQTPQPGRKWIRFLACSLLLQESVAAEGGINKSTADEDEDRAERDAGEDVESLEISAAEVLGVYEGETPSQEGQPEEGQEDGAALGRLGHSLILESFDRTGRTPKAELPLRLHLNCGTGLDVRRE